MSEKLKFSGFNKNGNIAKFEYLDEVEYCKLGIKYNACSITYNVSREEYEK